VASIANKCWFWRETENGQKKKAANLPHYPRSVQRLVSLGGELLAGGSGIVRN